MSEQKPVLPWYSQEFYRQAHEIAASRVRFSEHKGTRILIVDFTNAELDITRAVAAECVHVTTSQPPNSVLTLVEIEGIRFHTDAVKIGYEMVEKGQNHSRRTAVTGVSGFRFFLLQTIAETSKRPIRLFKSGEREQALDWLVAEEGAGAKAGR